MGRLLTKREVADLLRVSTRTIDRWRAAGIDMGLVSIRGVKRYREDVVQRLLDRSRVAPGR